MGEEVKEYCVRGMPEEEIDAMLYDSRQKDIKLDIDVSIDEDHFADNPQDLQNHRISTYYVYTSKSGKNYWLVLLFTSPDTSGLTRCELMSSGMKRVYYGDNYGDECKLWF